MKILIATMILLANTESGLARQCYRCDSTSSPDCGDPFSTVHSTRWGEECTTLITRPDQLAPLADIRHTDDNVSHSTSLKRVCVKSEVTTSSGVLEVRRGCSIYGYQACVRLENVAAAARETIRFCQSCDHELCNVAPRPVGALLVLTWCVGVVRGC